MLIQGSKLLKEMMFGKSRRLEANINHKLGISVRSLTII